MSTKKILLSLLVIFCCLFAGYGFYKTNSKDPFVAIIFTLGISGIGMSLLRKKS